jgi:hypothetical protein
MERMPQKRKRACACQQVTELELNCYQQSQIADGQGKASFLTQFANGSVDWLFVRQNRSDMKPSFT